MRPKIRHLLAATVLVSLAGCDVENDAPSVPSQPGTPAVGSSSDLSSFEGARAGQAEMGIQNLGYEPIRSEGLTTFWFNRATGACARIVTGNGRYKSVTMLPAQDC